MVLVDAPVFSLEQPKQLCQPLDTIAHLEALPRLVARKFQKTPLAIEFEAGIDPVNIPLHQEVSLFARQTATLCRLRMVDLLQDYPDPSHIAAAIEEGFLDSNFTISNGAVADEYLGGYGYSPIQNDSVLLSFALPDVLPFSRGLKKSSVLPRMSVQVLKGYGCKITDVFKRQRDILAPLRGLLLERINPDRVHDFARGQGSYDKGYYYLYEVGLDPHVMQEGKIVSLVAD